ncbi:DUF1178 family protein [Tropicibacter sp. R15_0]|uniref:DUF1178 family protein n=1 Tax=Tropicibacter sp. R15_0 TaxID=2821101 RepID=UPI001ADB617D|nr:DUF1178 family protein [Tropicibacter sp. R15_0]MBO9465186.1 DUF1178 family protein [Tropicibacter sp. R15_0]
MIQYSLKCANGHRFDSWFQSASAFDKLQGAGHVTCAVCGTSEVEKALMAPRVNKKAEAESNATDLRSPDTAAEEALAKIKAHVEENSDYVGKDFASEARAMHLGDSPERSIWGEAKPEDAKALIDDGIPVAPLPFVPNRKSN